MADDIVCFEGPLKITLNFADVDPMEHGVQLRLRVDYFGKKQVFNWAAECLWFEYEALRKFESDLADGCEGRLHDMSGYPVLHFERQSSQELLIINPQVERQSQDGECIAVRLKINAGSMHAFYTAFSQFAKWW